MSHPPESAATQASPSNEAVAPAAAPTPAPAPGHAASRPARMPLPPATFARLVLTLLGLVWFCIGLWGMADPVALARTVDLALKTDLARLEVRAMYGSLSVAIGLLHGAAMSRAVWLQPGTAAAAVLLAGLASGRVLSFAVDGFSGMFAVLLIVAEFGSAGLAGFAWWRLVRAPR